MGLLTADSLRLGVPFLAAALGAGYPARFVRGRRFCPVVDAHERAAAHRHRGPDLHRQADVAVGAARPPDRFVL